MLGLMLSLVLLAGWNAAPADFQFVVIGDTRPRFESENFEQFQGLLRKINALKPAFIINLGDLIYGYGPASKEKQWDKYESVIKAVAVPYYQLPGNHDTHSKAARAVYGKRFGRFYQSFDYGDCHFVLLDNTEDQRWGHLGPAQFQWLTADLEATQASSVFIFLHFPVWEPERITPESYEFWVKSLHPLFKQHRVRAVFGGHYHTYGPTREFDGIRYFITGGGGAELRPEYKKAGGDYHFVNVSVDTGSFDTRVVTQLGEMSDSEADVLGGLQFASQTVSRIGIKHSPQELRAGVTFDVAVSNPFPDFFRGSANWRLDTSSFSVKPDTIALEIPTGGTRRFQFTLVSLQDVAALQTLPVLQFNVVAGGRRYKFHREVRFLDAIRTPYCEQAPVLDGLLDDWALIPALRLDEATENESTLRTAYDAENLYLALSVPSADADEAKESGFADEVQVGLARRMSDTDFGGDFLRLGLNAGSNIAIARTPGQKSQAPVNGVRTIARKDETNTVYEVALPLRLLRTARPRQTGSIILDLSYAPRDNWAEDPAGAEASPNTFAYRVRYGSDSLVPIHFVELKLIPKK